MSTLYVNSPLGLLRLSEEEGSITGLLPVDCPGEDAAQPPAPVLHLAARQLEEYFAGARRSLDFPITPKGTDFQKQVWQGLREIPYGETTTYGRLAAKIGRPGASRAVGTAAGKNPILIAIPCHRLLAATNLGGFSCGLERKKLLLKLEAEREE